MNASLTDTERQIWRSTLALADILRLRVALDVKPVSGLSSADHSVLMHLSEAQEAHLGQGELAAEMHWSKSRISHQISRMQRRSLVERRATADTGRGVRIYLTEAGQQAVEAIESAHAEAVRRHLFRVATEEELTVIVRLADRLRE